MTQMRHKQLPEIAHAQTEQHTVALPTYSQNSVTALVRLVVSVRL